MHSHYDKHCSEEFEEFADYYWITASYRYWNRLKKRVYVKKRRRAIKQDTLKDIANSMS